MLFSTRVFAWIETIEIRHYSYLEIEDIWQWLKHLLDPAPPHSNWAYRR